MFRLSYRFRFTHVHTHVAGGPDHTEIAKRTTGDVFTASTGIEIVRSSGDFDVVTIRWCAHSLRAPEDLCGQFRSGGTPAVDLGGQ